MTGSQDRIEKFMDDEGTVRASVIVGTHVVEEMRAILNTYEIATVLIGRSMMGALLMAAHLKKGENVGVYFRGNGPLKLVFAEGDHDGATRAYTPEPHVQLALKDNKIDLSSAIGIGILEVVRGVAYSQNLSRGAVEIRTGQVGDDIAYYLFQSHQIPSVVALSVDLNKDGSVKTAGGVLIELMPGAGDKVIEKIEARVQKAKPLKELIAGGAQPQDLINEFLGDFKMIKLEHNADVRYQCRCSLERVKKALFLLGHAELDELIKDSKGGSHDVNCDFCGKKYTLTIEEIENLKTQSYKNSLN